jgi:hypothetical protein
MTHHRREQQLFTVFPALLSLEVHLFLTIFMCDVMSEEDEVTFTTIIQTVGIH